MKIQRVFSALFLAITLVLSNVSTVFAQPPLPSSFWGTVKLDGAIAPAGTVISARINGIQYATTTVTISGDAYYLVKVPGDDPATSDIEGGVSGDTVVFYIGGYVADQTGSWVSGPNVLLNLTGSTNHAPVANAQPISADEDTAKTITLTGTDSDGDALTYVIVTDPAHGILTGTAPVLTYTPAANYNGADSFTFKVNDGTVDSAPATVGITVAAVNDVPVANDQSIDTTRNTSKAVTLTGSDIEGSILTYIIVTDPAHGTLTGTGANRTYTPAANYNGADSFTFKVNDGTMDSAVATVSVNITFTNVAPVASPQSVSTNEDTAKAITLAGTDADGDILTYVVVTAPAHGILTGTGANQTYTPAANYNGADSFTFKVNDGTVDSAPATVSITVTAVNDVPVASPQSVSTNEDTAKAITLAGTDADGDTLTYVIVTDPAHGTLTGTVANRTYTPAANYNGVDSFTFKVNDGTVDSAPATVSITVTAVNNAPVASPQSVSTNEDTVKAITLAGTDVDGDTLTYVIVTDPAHGTLAGTGANRTYTPAVNYNGADSFTFKVNDGTVDSAPATVSITVTAVNNAPVASPQSVSTNEDTAKAITLAGTDADGDTLTYVIVTAPAHGTLTGTGANQTYTPAANYNGADSFTFKVNDGTVDSAPATVSITVTAVNDVPVASPQSVSTNEDTAKAITLAGTDSDGNTLTYVIVTAPVHGTLTGTGVNQTYTPAVNYNGADSFTFKVNDGTVDSAPATISITVTAVNDVPVANDQSVSTTRNTPKAITLTGSDIDGNSLTYIIVSTPSHGTLSGTGASRTYTPNTNYTGADSFTFKVNDGTVDSAVATVSINITFSNVAPVASPQSVSTNEDTVKAITLAGTDVDGDTLTYVIVTDPAHGTLTGTGANRTYTPAVNYNGADSFTFKVNDGTVDSAPATVSITVIAVNDVPVASPQSVSTNEDTAKAITLAGTDADGDILTYVIVTNPAHGTLTGTGANRTYTPAANYNGADSFTFKVNDGTVDSTPATVSITVTAVNDVPVANDQSVSTTRNTPKAIALTGSDIDGNSLTYIVVATPSHGTLSGTGASRTYTPNTNYTGTDSFTFKVNDGTMDSAVATVSVNITFTNVAPVASPQSVSTNEDTVKAITLAGTDADGDTLTYVIVTDPAHGTLTGTGANRTYTPAVNYNGADSFTFKVNDGTVDSAPATVSITVTAVNDVPVANDQSVSTTRNTPKAITLTGSDIDGNSLTYIIMATPSHGTLSGTGASRTYTPNTNYTGTDSFTFKVNDGTVDSTVATVSINITFANVAPVASPQSVSTNEDTAKAITLAGTDADGDTLTYVIVTNPAHGTLTGTGANRTYTPAANYNGADSFTFKVNDGTVDSTPATVSITVTAVNNPPTDISISKSNFNENQAVGTLVGTFSTTDSDMSDTFTYEFCGGTDDASFTINGDSLKTAVLFDYETKNTYSICVRSTDAATLSITRTFVITVNNLLDTQTFMDVPQGFWAARYIQAIYEAGITSGCTTNPLNYCPDASVTRAQMAIFIEKGMRGSGFTPPAATGTVFTDVPQGYWAAAWIEQLAADGITGGCGAGVYCPDAEVTRAQMAVFLLKAKHGSAYTPPASSGTVFTDVPQSHWAVAWVEELAAEGITSGCAAGLYCPESSVTRAQMAVFLQKVFNLPLP